MTLMLFWMFVSVIISAAIFAISIQKRNAPKSLSFIILSFLVFVFVLGRFFEATASGLEAAYLGTLLGYLGIPFVPMAMFLFIMDYYNIKVNKWLTLLLSILPLAAATMVVVPQLRKYFYTNYSYYPGPPIAQLMIEGSVFYYVFYAYFFLLLIACLVFSLWGAKKLSKIERWPSLAVFFAVFLPTFVGIMYTLRLTPLELDLAPFALCFSLIFIGVAIYRFNLLKILPLAKDAILEQMNDAFIILDNENRYVESNSSAKKLFPVLSGMRVGQMMNTEELFPKVTDGLDGRPLVSIMSNDVQQHYHLAKNEILQYGKKLCICYTLHDITDTRKLLTELKVMATYDNLTNIYNRASFYELSARAMEMACVQNTTVSALGIDIDHFKVINDTYGHFCGDEILKSLVKKISGRLRASDIFGRVGGEEFNVLLLNTNLDNAITLAQNLQKMTEAETFLFNDKKIPVTISIGVAVFDEQRHASLESLLVDADKALYESKKTGRNKVSFYCPSQQK